MWLVSDFVAFVVVWCVCDCWVCVFNCSLVVLFCVGFCGLVGFGLDYLVVDVLCFTLMLVLLIGFVVGCS